MFKVAVHAGWNLHLPAAPNKNNSDCSLPHFSIPPLTVYMSLKRLMLEPAFFAIPEIPDQLSKSSPPTPPFQAFSDGTPKISPP